jgi:hypothetical protein
MVQICQFGGLVMILKSSTLQANQYTQNELGCLADQYSAQGLFMWEVSSSHDALFVESILGWYFKGLSWLRSHVEHRKEMARPIIDICYIFILIHPLLIGEGFGGMIMTKDELYTWIRK